MTLDTRPNLDNEKFEQFSDDELNLSGTTRIDGTFRIQSGGTLNVQRGPIVAENVLTSDASGNTRWAEANRNIPVGLEGEAIFYEEDNTKNFTHGYTLEYATVVENDAELDVATGITPSFQEIFNTWERFSHWYPRRSDYEAMDITNFSPYYPYKQNPLSLADPPTYEEQDPNYPALDPNNSTNPLTQTDWDNGIAWGYDDNNDRIYLTANYNPYTGFISNEKYDRYSSQVTMSSTASDDDYMSTVIAFYEDEETGFQYTLSAIRNYNSSPNSNIQYAIVYNFSQNTTYSENYTPDFDYMSEEIIANGNSLVTTSGNDWDVAGQTIMKVERESDIITVQISQQGGTSIDTGTTLQIDLKDYSKLQKFRGPNKMGFGARSQENAYFSDLQLTILGSYIFYVTSGGTGHDTYEYSDSGSTWFLQDPQTVTLQDYVGFGRFVYSDLFDKTYYTNGDSTIIKLMAGGGGNVLTSADGVRKVITQSNHGFSIGDFIGWSGGTYNKAIADGTYDGEFIGLVNAVLDSDSFYVTQAGFVSGLTGLVTDNTYYLSTSTAGEITNTEPTTDGQVSKAVLVATSSGAGWVLPYPGVIVSSGATVISTADNGLTDNSGIVELGGSLCRNTIIDNLNTYNLEFSGGTLQYSDDYSGSISARSIPDAAWITGQTLATAANGLSVCGENVVLGGTLTGTTEILGNSNDLSFSDNSNFNIINTGTNFISGNTSTLIGNTQADIGVDNDAGSENTIVFSQNCALVTDSFNSEGLVYAADYSSVGSTNPRWIPDAAWITGQTGGGPLTGAGNGLSESNGNVVLGGALTGNTTICGASHNLNIGTVSSTLSSFCMNSDSSCIGSIGGTYNNTFRTDFCCVGLISCESGLGLYNELIIGPEGMTACFSGTSNAIVYADDYSSLFNARTLPDIAWVTGNTLTSGDNISLLNNDAGYVTSNNYVCAASGSGNGTLTLSRNGGLSDVTANLSHSHTSGDLPSTIVYEGENISLLTNNCGYLKSGDNISSLTNDCGYIKSYNNYYLNGASFNTGNGELTLCVNGATNQVVDLDGRYCTSVATPTLDEVTTAGNTSNVNVLMSSENATQYGGNFEIKYNSSTNSLDFNFIG